MDETICVRNQTFLRFFIIVFLVYYKKALNNLVHFNFFVKRNLRNLFKKLPLNRSKDLKYKLS